MSDHFHKRIEYPEPVLRYLRKKHVKDQELETCCDCPGCQTCKGFQRACTCDESPTIREALGLPTPSTTETKAQPEQTSGDDPNIPF